MVMIMIMIMIRSLFQSLEAEPGCCLTLSPLAHGHLRMVAAVRVGTVGQGEDCWDGRPGGRLGLARGKI